MTPQEHDREHAFVFAEYRKALRDGKPRDGLIRMLRGSDRQWAGQWPRYYHAFGSSVLHTSPSCRTIASGRNARALVTLQWWLSGRGPTMPLCRHCMKNPPRLPRQGAGRSVSTQPLPVAHS
jgi:hypothetical protein